MIEITVNYTTEKNTIGHLEYIINAPNIQSINGNILNIITPYVLRQLGGSEEEWNISTVNDTLYVFEWKNINNKLKQCPLQRTRTFRPLRDRIVIILQHAL
jgi:hypothetical protein